ncbi:P-loop containing nucleoside triphosphate hydrolase [Pseudocohnilembus persalinus]|uniref:p-loop containing nucleoside triphosphate hydrolase n=1 Tax=Pseudocohnilembus persalinus TaxID=266149 RepID=A0A0V0QV75_PSEPJ|nr:P-loop containing nucleoside triphosphate hydrolase [Pseudocohnilembus persalinus]|eukprot:KRX05888.1 P-loop containing nucleoside triphosphate hydrolase [Pseudocohnilembus persalinus]
MAVKISRVDESHCQSKDFPQVTNFSLLENSYINEENNKGLWIYHDDKESEETFQFDDFLKKKQQNQSDLLIENKLDQQEQADSQQTKTLIIDCQGFYEKQETENMEKIQNNIFMFQILISSLLIYLTKGQIDNEQIEKLSSYMQIAKNLQIQQGQNNIDIFPSLFWILKDFDLQREGDINTPKEYLEKALELKNGVSQQVENRNRTKRLLKSFFQDKQCFPIKEQEQQQFCLNNSEQIENLQEQNNDDYNYQSELMKCKEKILRKLKPKLCNNTQLNANQMIFLIQEILNHLNNQQVPNMQKMVEIILQNKIKEIKQDN